eukprot:560421-Rhodomonas_salina.3
MRKCYAMSGTAIGYAVRALQYLVQREVRDAMRGTEKGALHCEIKYKKPQSRYNLYQECGFLCLTSGCRQCAVLEVRYAARVLREVRGTEIGYAATRADGGGEPHAACYGGLSPYALAMQCPILT